MKLGADGVQMATRFVATNECDASDEFKMAYLNSKKEDIQIVSSPVGLPGRAILNNFVAKTKEGKVPVKRCYNCMIPCNPADTPYCISQALIDSVEGRTNDGLVFCGENAYRLDKIIPVQELMDILEKELLES